MRVCASRKDCAVFVYLLNGVLQLAGVIFLASWGFKTSQPQRIISGLKETFVKKHVVNMTNKAEIRPEEQIEKAECCKENLWNKIQLKGP